MLTILTVVIILQHIHMPDHYVVDFKLMQCHMAIES